MRQAFDFTNYSTDHSAAFARIGLQHRRQWQTPARGFNGAQRRERTITT
jgi:hypothetical protein